MNPLSLIPTWLIAALIVAIPLGLFAGKQYVRAERAEKQVAAEVATRANIIAAAASANAAQLLTDLNETQRRLDAQAESVRDATKAASVVRAELVDVRTAAQRMRQRADADRDRADTYAGSLDPATAGLLATTRAQRDLYTDLFFRAQDRAVGVGEEAERYRIAGESCERDYASLSIKTRAP